MTIRKKYSKFMGVIAIALSLSACLNGNSGSDSAALQITITNPANASEIATPDFVVNLVGKVDSTTSIESVKWSNDRGGSGTANGKESWATGNIVLKLGVNNITITATDVDGLSSSKGIAVERESKPSGSANGVTSSIAMYSYRSNLSNAAPVKGASIDARPVYFFLTPSDNWMKRGIRKIDYLCCKGISGPGAGDAFGPQMSVSTKPWSLLIDLSGLEPGGTRRIKTVATFNDGSGTASQTFDFALGTNAVKSNTAPTISGIPSGTASAGIVYKFLPIARDADGDSLSFSITRKPVWATFNRSTGKLSGTPGAGQAGTYSGIIISVSDGRTTASLPAFSISVVAAASGSATLSWIPPTQRVDNTPLTDLAGYRIHYGRTSGSYGNKLTINNPGITTYVVDNLPAGTWYFAITARDSAGQYSAYSNQGQKTIQ